MWKWKEELKWVYSGIAAYFSDIHFCQIKFISVSCDSESGNHEGPQRDKGN